MNPSLLDLELEGVWAITSFFSLFPLKHCDRINSSLNGSSPMFVSIESDANRALVIHVINLI